MREFTVTFVSALVCIPLVLVGIGVASAQVMQSTNYRIQSDSVNIGGGLSTSTNYSLESTGGEAATGESSSATYNLHAGYQQMDSVYIGITGASDVTMSPSIPGISGGTANGSTTVTVVTDSPSGYQLTIRAAGSPAMQKGGDSIADYVPGADPSFDFNVNPTDAYFGYSPEGADIVQRFKDDGGACNIGTKDSPLACWDGLSTSAAVIAESTTANQPDGATTTVRFRVGIGGSVIQPPGTYTATTTLTALPL